MWSNTHRGQKLLHHLPKSIYSGTHTTQRQIQTHTDTRKPRHPFTQTLTIRAGMELHTQMQTHKHGKYRSTHTGAQRDLQKSQHRKRIQI